MARFSRTLSAVDSSPPAANPPGYVNAESDFVVILAALLCALICIIGLLAIARCAWLRRTVPDNTAPFPSPAADKGLRKNVLRSLPKFPYGASSRFDSTECAICLGEFRDGEVVRVLPQCGHGFHVGCIDAWLRSHSTCPSCRRVLAVTVCRRCGRCPAASDDSKARVHSSDYEAPTVINDALSPHFPLESCNLPIPSLFLFLIK